MDLPEELKDRIRFRISAFLDAMEAAGRFTADELVTVIWPEINEASARDAAETVEAELDRNGLGAKPHVVPADYSGRQMLAAALTDAVLPFAEQHQFLDIAVERNELLESLEALRRYGLLWSWSDGSLESAIDGDFEDGPIQFTVTLTPAGVHAITKLVASDAASGEVFRTLLRDVMTEEQLGR